MVVSKAMSSSSSEEEVAAPKIKTKAVKAPVDSSSEDEAPQKKVKIAQKTKVIEAASDDSDDSDGEPAKPVAKKQKDKDGAEKAKNKSGDSGDKTKEKGDDAANQLKLIVMGLPWKVDEKAVKKDFASCGAIVNVKVLMNDDGKSKGMAFITFKNAEGASACLKKDGDTTTYDGRTLRIHRAKTKPEVKAKVAASKDEKKPERKDEKKTEKKAERKPEKSNAGNGGLTLNISSLKSSDIINMDVISKLGRMQEQKDWQAMATLAKKIVTRAEKAMTEKTGTTKDKHKFRVFVSGLPVEDFDETAFKKRFADCGDITFAWLPVKSGGAGKGFGAIGYKTQEAFDKALAYNGTKCKGNVLTVVKSEPAGGQKAEAPVAGKAKEQASKRKDVPADEEEAPPKKKKKVVEEEASSDDEAARKAAKKAKKAAK